MTTNTIPIRGHSSFFSKTTLGGGVPRRKTPFIPFSIPTPLPLLSQNVQEQIFNSGYCSVVVIYHPTAPPADIY